MYWPCFLYLCVFAGRYFSICVYLLGGITVYVCISRGYKWTRLADTSRHDKALLPEKLTPLLTLRTAFHTPALAISNLLTVYHTPAPGISNLLTGYHTPAPGISNLLTVYHTPALCILYLFTVFAHCISTLFIVFFTTDPSNFTLLTVLYTPAFCISYFRLIILTLCYLILLPVFNIPALFTSFIVFFSRSQISVF